MQIQLHAQIIEAGVVDYIHTFAFVTFFTSYINLKCLQSGSTFTFGVIVIKADAMLKINRQTDYAVCVVFAHTKSSEDVRLSSKHIQDEDDDWLRLIPVIIAGRGILTWVNEVSANAVAVKIKTDLRERLFSHILNLGPAYTRGQRTGELTTAAGIEALDAYYSQYLPQLVITSLVPISILLFVFPIDLLSGFIMLVTAPLIPFFMILIGKGAEIVTKRQYETLSRLSAHFLDCLQGLTTLKLFGRSKSYTKNIETISNQFRDRTLEVLRVTFLSALALELLATLSTAIIAVEIGFRLLYAKMEFREAFFLLILAPEFYMPLRTLGARFHAGMSGTTAAKRIFEILDTPLPAPAANIHSPLFISQISNSRISLTFIPLKPHRHSSTSIGK